MHIGVDATCWSNTRGYGRHARALLTALVRIDKGNRYTFVVDSAESLFDLPREAAARQSGAAAPAALAASANGHRSVHDMWRMSRALSDAGFDVVLFPTAYSFVPVFSRARKIVVIHDVIAERYPKLALSTTRARLFWKLKVSVARRQADAIATVSDYSRRAIVDQFGVASESVSVVGEAADPIFRVLDDPLPTPTLNSLGIPTGGRTISYLGGFSPHKNLETLVSAFAQIAASDSFRDVRLVMVGENRKEVFHSTFTDLQRQVDSLGLTGRVLFTGYLPDEDVVALLNLSTVLVLPSLMEGFGLPAIEAAACGCPVIATTASPLPQLLGDGGLYFDPLDQQALLDHLVRVLESGGLRTQMRHAGMAAAARLTWEAAARQMMDVLADVAERPSSDSSHSSSTRRQKR